MIGLSRLTRASEMTAFGALGLVFSKRENNRTAISTDDARFQTLYNACTAEKIPLR